MSKLLADLDLALWFPTRSRNHVMYNVVWLDNSLLVAKNSINQSLQREFGTKMPITEKSHFRLQILHEIISLFLSQRWEGSCPNIHQSCRNDSRLCSESHTRRLNDELFERYCFLEGISECRIDWGSGLETMHSGACSRPTLVQAFCVWVAVLPCCSEKLLKNMNN